MIDLSRLRNTYVLLRHGQSEANREGIIVSDPAVGTVRYGLTEQGRESVRRSVMAAGLPEDTVIVSSDFLRTKQTAEIAADCIGAAAPHLDERLRERRFGIFEGTSDRQYDIAWARDREGRDVGDGVESAQAVLVRMLDCIADIERSQEGKTVLLVSHGDPIDILQARTKEVSLAERRSTDPISPGEIQWLAQERAAS